MLEPNGSTSPHFEKETSSGGALWQISHHFVVSWSPHSQTRPKTNRSRHVDFRSRPVSVAEPDAEHSAHRLGCGFHYVRHDEAVQRSADASWPAAARALVDDGNRRDPGSF